MQVAATEKDKIKVFRIVSRLNYGGPTRQLLPLCRDLNKEEFTSVLFFGNADAVEGENITALLEANIVLERIPTLKRSIQGWADFLTFWKLFRIFRQQRPDIVHTHMAKAGVLGRLAAWLARVPIRVHTYHGVNFHGHFAKFGSYLSMICERWLAKITHALIAVSHCVAQQVKTAHIDQGKKIQIIFPGLDIEPFLAVAYQRTGKLRKRFGIRDEHFFIGFIGRLTEVKNPNDFLAMAAGLTLLEPQLRFVFLGAGEQRTELMEKVKSLDLTDKVFFAGWRDDMPDCLADLDLVVATSRNEGMPLSIIEAMAAGRAVVARAVGGLPELIDNHVNGILVAPGEDQSLEEAVLELYHDATQRQRIAQQARLHMRERFDSKRLVRDTEKLYRELFSIFQAN